jgi:hypothetical protein
MIIDREHIRAKIFHPLIDFRNGAISKGCASQQIEQIFLPTFYKANHYEITLREINDTLESQKDDGGLDSTKEGILKMVKETLDKYEQ